MRFTILTALCMAFPGCTKRTGVSEAEYLGSSLEIDSNRVLVDLVRKTEYHETGFMHDRDVTEYDYRYVVLDLADPADPEPLKSHGDHKLSLGVVDGNEVLLSPWYYLDLAGDKLLRTGFDAAKIPRPDPRPYTLSTHVEPGPGPGLYLVDTWFEPREPMDTGIREWFVFDRVKGTYASLLRDSTGTVLDLIYHDRIPWALYRVDSLTVAHRALGGAAMERIFALPDTLTEWKARADYAKGPRGLFLQFKCGDCHPAPPYRYRNASQDSATWEEWGYYLPASLLNTLKVEPNSLLTSVKVSRYSDSASARVFDLSSYLR